MLGIVLGLASSVAWGVSDFLGGLQSRRISALSVLLVSQPYGYRLGQWVRAERRRGRRTPIYLHRSHGHELVAAAQMAELRDRVKASARG